MSAKLIRTILVEDDSETVSALRSALERHADFAVVAAYPDIRRAKAAHLSADLAIVDVKLPDGSGIDLIAHCKEKNPAMKILMFTAIEDGDILLKAMSSGASGYVLKGVDGDTLLDHARVAAKGGVTFSGVVAHSILAQARKNQGDTPLSPREIDTLRHLALGFTSKEIAKALRLSAATVRKHVENIYRKLDVNSKSGAILLGIETGILRKP